MVVLTQSFSGGYAQEGTKYYNSHLQRVLPKLLPRPNHFTYKLVKKLVLTELDFLGVYTKLKAFIPSSINETDFNNNPQSRRKLVSGPRI
jgi:iron complex outermembrane receptor protein